MQHCALNVALYGGPGKRWAFTERQGSNVERDRLQLHIGPNALAWKDSTLTILIDERSAPLPSKIVGTVKVHVDAPPNKARALDSGMHHWWRPIAPCARVEVALVNPALRWAGNAYLDSNAGDEPIEGAFSGWNWSRASVRTGTAVLFDTRRRDAPPESLAIYFDRSGNSEDFSPPPRADLPRTGWRVARETRSEAAKAPVDLHTLEDTPFYARSLVSARLLGQDIVAMHESLCLDRFRAGWVQRLLPFRMRRA